MPDRIARIEERYHALMSALRTQLFEAQQFGEIFDLGARTKSGRVCPDLWKQAVDEVDDEEDVLEGQLADRIRRSSLMPLVREAQADLRERTELEAEREAKIARINDDFDRIAPQPHMAVDAYNRARVELFREKIAARGLDLCSGCLKPRTDVESVLVEERVKVINSDCGYGAWECVDDRNRLGHLCGKCRRDANRDPHEDTTYSVTYPAKLQNGDWMMLQDDVWKPLPENVIMPPAFTLGNDTLAEEWDIPPKMYIGDEGITFGVSYSWESVPLDIPADSPPACV